MIDENKLRSNRADQIDVSGIRRAFQLGARLENPINLSIGQPHFPVPDEIKNATMEAIQADAFQGHVGHSLVGILFNQLHGGVSWSDESTVTCFAPTRSRWIDQGYVGRHATAGTFYLGNP